MADISAEGHSCSVPALTNAIHGTVGTSATAPEVYGRRPVLLLCAGGLLCVALLKLAEAYWTKAVSISFDPWAFGAFPVAQYFLGRDRRATLLACVIGLLLTFALFYFLPTLGDFAEPLGFGFGSLVVLSGIILLLPQRRSRAVFALAAGALVIIGQQLSKIGQEFTATDLLTYDHRAYLVDLSLGCDPVATVIAAANTLPVLLKQGLIVVLYLSYTSLMLIMACAILIHLRNQSERWSLTLTAMLLAGGVGGMLYHIFPAAGPLFAYPSFPTMPSPADLSTIAAPVDVRLPRNCMPSLHTAWALLIVFSTSGMRRSIRLCAVGFAACVIIATLMLGQHYLIDLIVAVPFAVAIQALAHSLLGRQPPSVGFWIGSACVTGWLFVLVAHVGWLLDVRGITLAASAATLTLSAVAHRRGTAIELRTWWPIAAYIAPWRRRMKGAVFFSGT